MAGDTGHYQATPRRDGDAAASRSGPITGLVWHRRIHRCRYMVRGKDRRGDCEASAVKCLALSGLRDERHEPTTLVKPSLSPWTLGQLRQPQNRVFLSSLHNGRATSAPCGSK